MTKAICKICGDFLESKTRHEFVDCSCKKSFLDGGNDYVRCTLDTRIITEKDIIHPDSSMDYNHVIGNKKCNEGWCNKGSHYPKQCVCGGLIHADFGDENRDGDYWLYTKCDKCGGTE